MSFLSELRRRKVLRAAFAYAVLFWLLVQVAGLLLDAFDAPGWIFRSIIVLLAVGFPIALILSWFFELTTDGLIKSTDLTQHEEQSNTFRRYLNPIIISMLSAAVILFSMDKMGWISSPLEDGFVKQKHSTSQPSSLAVLPFTNRSSQTENAYFVDGIHDDLLTMLAKINSLSVTSRTSVMRYQDSKMSIPEISNELGVKYILEGAVQREGNQIRVNAQLIDAGNDDHLWAETFDRQLSTSNLFAIQSNIARAIATALRAELSSSDENLLDTIPTQSLAAYDAYLQGKQAQLKNSIEAYESALTYFQEAISLDASFAGAYAGLCEVQLGMYSKTADTSHFSAAKTACEQALTIDAGLSEVHIALGTLFRRNGDYGRAEAEQRMVLETEPQNVEAMTELGYTLAEQGKIRESETWLLKAELIQPDHWPVHDALYNFYYRFDDQPDRYERAATHAMRVVELNPNNSAAWNNLGTVYHGLQQYDSAKAAWDMALQLKPTRTAYTNRGLQYSNDGDFAASADMQLKAIELAPNDHRVWGRLAESYRAMGDQESKQKEAFATAIPLAEAALEINDQNWRTRADLAVYYSAVDRKDDALRQIEAALNIANRNPEALLSAVFVNLRLGDQEATLSILEEMLEADATYRIYIVNDPELAPLRGVERFDRLFDP